jgi:hypothetical protein
MLASAGRSCRSRLAVGTKWRASSLLCRKLRSIPIEALLHRICWNLEFGCSNFTRGHFDRLRHRIITVPLEPVHIESGRHFSFSAVDLEMNEGVTAGDRQCHPRRAVVGCVALP